jgi:hypothetical protein
MRCRETNTLDLLKECDYILSKALAGKNAIVMITCLVFTAHEDGDAFAFDVEDKFACPLCEDGEKLRYPLFETDTKWVLKWSWHYYVARGHIYFERIDGEDSRGLPWMKAAAIERQIAKYNRRAGTNYHL